MLWIEAFRYRKQHPHFCSATQDNMADKLRNQQELERLQAKYVGTGHPDTTSWEWKTNIYRDTYSSIAGHPPMLSYMALAENEPTQLLRARLIRKMMQPAGPPPQRED
ncbi:splicing factor 3B subunit 10-domain-containing protein [Colletotrichum godetiae]|uniref:Splicing factor 3B subunit 10-domain-containing protein n=1 Tax=Colletotrichum godetiae TaxID=1209918 RepID=A0AAJ0B0R5_9PEZI|nr:splicing factor 3B subunit 10-domain-containing protein [Colletotrichum godetiae]KAK1701323.1 splicing factor 3B subunit 10-domain-containing protein [Colletotrichum godetiae]